MKTLLDLHLPQSLRDAIRVAQKRITVEFNVERLVLFGSIVRGEADEESDVDLLIVLREHVNHQTRNQISRIIFDLNLEYDTNLSGLVVEQMAWDEGLLTALPIHAEIEKEGLRL